jgi:hypothetical protein
MAVQKICQFPGEKPSPMEVFLFDLQGYLVLKNALSAAEVQALNQTIDGVPPLQPGEWFEWVHREQCEASRGLALQQVYELGVPFEALLDHPAWIEKVRHFVGGEGDFDYHHGALFVDENFVSVRGPGEAIGMHSGGHKHVMRTQFRCENQRFHCGQINILLALTDIGPGDGATMVVPASHKANFPHPELGEKAIREGASMDGCTGAIEVYMEAGDALLFVDAIAHGSAKRVNPGDRRICVYRYGPSWSNFRFGYRPSPALLERLTPERRQLVYPWTERRPPNA